MGSRTTVCRLKFFEQVLLDPSRYAVAGERPVRHDDAGPPAGCSSLPGRRSFRMISWRNSNAVSESADRAGKLRWIPFSSSPPNGGLVTITSTRSRSPISLMRKRKRVEWVDLRRLDAVEEKVHLAQQVRQRLRLDSEQCSVLETFEVLDCLCTSGSMCSYASTRKPPVPAAGSRTISPSADRPP